MRKFCFIPVACLFASTIASQALAAPCDANTVVLRGSSAAQPILKALSAVAATQSIRIAYSTVCSSSGGVYEALTSPTDAARDQAGFTATLLDDATQCTPVFADIGVSDVYASSMKGVDPGTSGGCTIGRLPDTITFPATVTDTLGPVQAFTFDVHDDTTFPIAIDNGAAFNVFGVTSHVAGDAQYAVMPWTNQTLIFGRSEGSGSWQTIARNLGLITAKPVDATQVQGSAGVLLGMLDTSPSAAAIGFAALNDIATSATPLKVRPLAFKAKDQDFAYYTDSTSTAKDMINVRDGHFQTWANLHFFARKDTGGDYGPKVKALFAILASKDAVAAIAKVRAVPDCAMQVSRPGDAADFATYKPAQACGCFFEATASGTAPASCTTCTDDTTCGANGQCVFGYCEAK